MHRASLGMDILRAPVNVALAPVFLLVRLAAAVMIRLRMPRAGRWLAARRVLLRTDASRAVERAVIDELLSGRARDDDRASWAPLVEDYVATRSAVAEIATTLVVLCVGLIAFRAATPGVLSLAPLVSDRAAYNAAVSGFPLGETLGHAWYGVFHPDLSGGFVAIVAVLLVFSASVLTTFAGIVADPLQTALGIHQRRLGRLLAQIGSAEKTPPAIAQEHLLARVADLSDAAAALFRILRP